MVARQATTAALAAVGVLTLGLGVGWWLMQQQRKAKDAAIEQQQAQKAKREAAVARQPNPDELASLFEEISKRLGRLLVDLTTWESRERNRLLQEGRHCPILVAG